MSGKKGRKSYWDVFKEWCLQHEEEPIGDELLEKARHLILESPGITRGEVAKRLSVSEDTVNRHLSNVVARLRPPSSLKADKEAESEEARAVGPTREVTRALDREYARMLQRLTEKTGWFIDAMSEIGWYSTMLAFQYAKVDINRLEEKVSEFRDAGAFADYVKKMLSAMIQASHDAARVLELEEENRALEAGYDYALEVARQAIEQRDHVLQLLRAAIMSMCEQDLRRFALAYAIYQVVLAGRRGEKKEGATGE